MDARGKFGEQERSVRVARDAAESKSSFLRTHYNIKHVISRSHLTAKPKAHGNIKRLTAKPRGSPNDFFMSREIVKICLQYYYKFFATQIR